MSSLSECLPWMTVGLVESVAIVTLNLCTIIVFVRNRNLRKRGTYLVINLSVIDMFVGGVNVPYSRFYINGIKCHLWKWRGDWTYSFILILMGLLLFGSLINVAIIALERVHATFFPFRHRVLKEWVYRLTIAVVWVTSVLMWVAYTLLEYFEETFYHGQYLCVTFISICLLIICVSYTCIVIKFRCGAQPQHHGAASRERKLTMTLLIVTVVSLLLYLPHTVLWFTISISKFEIFSSLSPAVVSRINSALSVLLYANSLVNPILYAMRMPEYRSAFLALFCKPQEQRQVAVFPLREI